MSEDGNQLHLVRDATTDGATILVRMLADGGVPTAIGGIIAATHYGGGLCPLDIELIVNGADQERAFNILTSHGARPSVPEDPEQQQQQQQQPATFQQWRERAPSYRFGDRRRMRLCCVPIYELPETGDPVDDALRPFVILYSAETVGLPGLRLTGRGSGETAAAAASECGSSYTPISSIVTAYRATSTCLVPTFRCLVAAEMHVLLRHADYQSLPWGQHAAQLSELLRSPSCPGGYDSLPELVNPELARFADWMRLYLRDGSVDGDLGQLKEAYCRRMASSQDTTDHSSCMS